jgi:spore germination protein KC
MKRTAIFVLWLGCLLSLTGCWNKFELTDWAFVQAIGIDDSPEGKVEVTTHFYKPGGGGSLEGGPQGPSAFNITTKADTLFEAVRDIPLQLGRKAQWSHMRIIIISDRLAKKRNMLELTDYFFRDNEPRETVTVIMSKGSAKNYLIQQPYIESTIGQQLREMSRSSAKLAAKTKYVTLLDLAVQFRNQTGIALLPYVYSSSGSSKEEIAVSQLAVLKDGKLVNDFLTSANVESLLILRNEFKFGVFEVPCKEGGKESLEVNALHTKKKIIPNSDTVTVHLETKFEGSFGEIRCTEALTLDAEKQVAERIRKYMEGELRKAVDVAQQKKLDLLGIGNWLYQYHPSLWSKWSNDWDNRFAQAKFDIHVDVVLVNSGMLISKPYYK